MKSNNELSEDGKRLVKELRNDQESKPIFNKIQELNETLKNLDVNDILYLTYNLYPDYAAQSTISEKVTSDKLESFKLNVNDFKEDQILSVRSDKGNDIKIKREGNKLIILGD